MKISTFDLYGNQNSKNHSVNIYYDVFFDGENIKFNKKEEKTLAKNELNYFLNNSDYKICHNFYGYDSEKLPGLEKHFENNIDSLLINSLISFQKPHHNLKKSYNNTPIEDANTTFEVLEKNIIIFDSFNTNLKNILYFLLKNNEKYNSFFYFYNKITNKKEININIKEEITLFLKNNNINPQNIYFFEKYLEKKGEYNFLALAYIFLFLDKKTISLGDFVSNNIFLKKNLNNILSELFPLLTKKFDENILDYLKEFSGFSNFRGTTQTKGVSYSLKNKDFLTILSTGGGKSLIYQLPAYITGKYLGGLTLVITPLKALIKDQIDGLRNKGFNGVDKLSGDQTKLEKDIIYDKIKSGYLKILFLTPESLRNKNLLELFKNRFISRVVVDEAHTIILWGVEFRPDYFFIKYFIKDLQEISLNNNIKTTLLTATATKDVENDLLKYFSERNIEIIKNENILKENIAGSVINIKDKNTKEHLILEKIKEIDIENNPTIIFTNRRKKAETLEDIFSKNNIKSKYFHAGLSEQNKKEIQKNFIKGDLNLIIATKAFGMGIDKENVRYVIHYDLPGNVEDYTQEIGRAGRDGKMSKNIIFYNKDNIKKKIGKIKNNSLKYTNFIYFLKNVDFKEKITLSPRDIAIKSGIKTNEKNWTTKVKILLSFLEKEEFFGINILNRKYDSNLVLFNNIENKILNNCYKKIEDDNYLNREEKILAKEIAYKIIEEKLALDLNKLEENFIENMGEEFNFRKIRIFKIVKIIKSLQILSKSDKNDDIIIEATNLYKEESYRKKLYNIFKKRLNNIENFKEENEESKFYNYLKSYYLSKNYLSEKNGILKISNKNRLEKHFEICFKIGILILENIFQKKENLDKKISVSMKELLIFIQKNHKSNFTITELKEVLFFLFSLKIINIRNGVLVFLNRFTIFFDPYIIEKKENFKKYIETPEFRKELQKKLDDFIEMKTLKLEALERIVQVLDKKGINDYTKLTNYYFSTPIKEFSEKISQKND